VAAGAGEQAVAGDGQQRDGEHAGGATIALVAPRRSVHRRAAAAGATSRATARMVSTAGIDVTKVTSSSSMATSRASTG
jgi:hypothetical protein